MGDVVRVLLVVGLLLAVISTPGITKELNQATTTVRIVIPVVQQLTIVDPVALSFAYPWDGLERGLPLIISDVGLMQIQSNASWFLSAQAFQGEGFQIYAKPHNTHIDWKPVNEFSNWTGPMGSYEYSWDLKIEAAGTPEPGSKTVQLVFTLSHL